MPAYYNEIDPFAAQWLRNLIAAGHIAPGDVDERSIADVQPADLVGYRQCHFFAGIGVWSYALRLAGWSDDEEVWTGSCPCQPFSAAGKRAGFADERHLWPAWSRLIAERRPRTVFGEQVASRDGLAWLDVVRADLEAGAYTVGAVVLPAAGLGAPHGRHRIWFVADAERRAAERYGLAVGDATRRDQGREEERQRLWADARDGGESGRVADPGRSERGPHAPRGDDDHRQSEGRPEATGGTRERGPACLMGDPGREGSQGLAGDGDERDEPGRDGPLAAGSARATGEPCDVGDADGERRDGLAVRLRLGRSHEAGVETAGPSPVNGFWRDAEWIWCRDEKWRPAQPGSFPLAARAPARVGRLRAYGNCLPAPVAEAFIAAYRSLDRAR